MSAFEATLPSSLTTARSFINEPRSSTFLTRFSPGPLDQIIQWLARFILAPLIRFVQVSLSFMKDSIMWLKEPIEKLQFLNNWLTSGMRVSWQEASFLYQLGCPLLDSMPPISHSRFFHELLNWHGLPTFLSYVHQMSYHSHLLFSRSEESFVFLGDNISHEKIYRDLLAAFLASRIATHWQEKIDQESAAIPSEYAPFSSPITPFSSSTDTRLYHIDKVAIHQLKAKGHNEAFYFLMMQQVPQRNRQPVKQTLSMGRDTLPYFINPLNLEGRLRQLSPFIENLNYFFQFTKPLYDRTRYFVVPSPQAPSMAQKSLQVLGLLLEEIRNLRIRCAIWLKGSFQTKLSSIKNRIEHAVAWSWAHFLWPRPLLLNLWEVERILEPFYAQHAFLHTYEVSHFLAQELPIIRNLALELSKPEARNDAYAEYEQALLANRIACWIQKKMDCHLTTVLQKHRVLHPFSQYWEKDELSKLMQIDQNAMSLLESIGVLANVYTRLMTKLQNMPSHCRGYFDAYTEERMSNISQRAPLALNIPFVLNSSQTAFEESAVPHATMPTQMPITNGQSFLADVNPALLSTYSDQSGSSGEGVVLRIATSFPVTLPSSFLHSSATAGGIPSTPHLLSLNPTEHQPTSEDSFKDLPPRVFSFEDGAY